jgi:hypothetical protein
MAVMVASTMHILTKQETPEITSKLTDSKEGDVIDFTHLLSYNEANIMTRALSTCLAIKMNLFQARVKFAILSTMSLAHSLLKNLFLCIYHQHTGEEEELSYFFHCVLCTLYLYRQENKSSALFIFPIYKMTILNS